jgi:hypothetical protein
VHNHHPSANITHALVPAVLLCFAPQIVRTQPGAQTQTFVIHGTPRTCSGITQLDSALAGEYQPFFAGWTERDYVDAIAWSQACSEYGWHIQGRPRIPTLLAQHDKALGLAQNQTGSNSSTGGALPAAAVQASVAAPPQTELSAATGGGSPGPSGQAASAAPVQAVASAPTSSAGPAPIPVPIPVQAQTVSSAATGGGPPSPSSQATVTMPVQAAPGAATGEVLPTPSAQAAVPPPAQAMPSAATGNVVPNPSVQAAVPAPSQAVPSPTQAVPSSTQAVPTPTEAVLTAAPPGSALPAPVPVAIPVQAHAASSAAASGAPPAPQGRNQMASDGEEDSFLTDNYFKEHFHQEALWVANRANLDIGSDGGAPSNWSSNGIPAQMKNRVTADKIVLYCARKTNSGEAGKRPLLWDLRWCEAEEASAYNRLVSGNEFPTAGRGVLLGCAGVDSYIHLERCVATLTEVGQR